jgi:NAD(P)-dependent dehydrogenase (short-subunit alcohol dehydrogenase family)
MKRSCVVTGAGRGIGKAIATRLIADGRHVVGLDLDDEALEWLRGYEVENAATVVVGDATDEATAEQAATEAKLTGFFDGWVNNAAVFRRTPGATSSATEMREGIAQNLDAAIVGALTAVRHFRASQTPGSIVNISSIQARQSVPGWVAYATAKAGIEGFTRSLAVDLAEHGIRVNAVAPATIAAEAYDAWLQRVTPEVRERVEQEMALLHPLGRVGNPAEVASTVAFLLSDESSFITGAIIPVDGGRSVMTRDPEG